MSKFFNSSFVKGDFLGYLFLFIVGLFVFKPSFSMGLYGDEWQMLWFSKAINIGTYHVLPTDIWNSYMNEMVAFDWLSNIFGYDGRFYYIFSFCCRLLAVYTCYWFFNKRIGSKFVTFLISCLFLVSPVGIEATDWARNFDSYLGIAVLIIVIDKLYELKTLRDALLAILFSIGLFLINPLRSHGNILVILGLIFVNILGGKNNKYNWMTGFAILSIYLCFIKIQIFGGLTTFNFFALEEYLPYIKNFVGNIGRVFVPSIDNQQYIFGLIGLSFYIWKSNTFKIFSWLKSFILGGYLISFIFVQFHIISSLPFTKSIYIGSFFIFWFFVVITIDFITRKNEQFKQSAICLLLSSAFLLFPFIRQPHFQAASDHRYLIYSSLTIIFILGFLLQSLQDKAKKIIVLCCIGFIILFFTDSTQSYLLGKSISHNYHYSQFIWDQIYYLSKDFNMQKKTNVIFIQNDFTNSSVFGDSVNFGFMFRYGITFNVYQEKYLPYMMVEDRSGIYSLFTDGKRSLAYFPEIKKFKIEDSIFFRIDNGKVQRLTFEEVVNDK